jgi:soluble lytic murein transglycosylase-like protein
MTIKPLGPEAIMARMQEIKAKMAEVFPEQLQTFITGDSGLTGSIGSLGGANANKPFDPLAPGVSITGGDPQIRSMIEKAAGQAGIEPELLDALVASESGYDPNARSRAGALGLSQLMPGTAQSLGVTNPFDPWQNLQGGANYLSQMLKRFGDKRLALAAYNAGPGAVEKAGGIPNYRETQSYVDKVMRLYEMRKGR